MASVLSVFKSVVNGFMELFRTKIKQIRPIFKLVIASLISGTFFHVSL